MPICGVMRHGMRWRNMVMKRAIAVLLAVLMLTSMMPTAALAAIVNIQGGGQFAPIQPDRPISPVEPDEPYEPSDTVTPGQPGKPSGGAVKADDAHNYRWSTLLPASCIVEGIQKGVCKDCGHTVTRSAGRGNHSYGEWEIVSTPEDGCGMIVRRHICQLCGYTAEESLYPEEALYRGIRNRTDDVWEMQQALIDQGYLSGEPDGAFGPNTEKGVKRFQKAAGFKEDGIAWGPVLSALLGRDVSRLDEVLLEIVGVTEPMLSEPPVNEAKILNSGYEVDEVEWYDAGEKMWQRDAYMTGEPYEIRIVLDKESTRRVAYSATVNGYAATVEPYEEKQLLVTCEMICGDPGAGMKTQTMPGFKKIVTEVGVYAIEIPAVGQNISYQGFAEGEGYAMSGAGGFSAIKWTDLTENKTVTAKNTFVADHEYSVEVNLTAKDGYVFAKPASSIAATVNGMEATALEGSDAMNIIVRKSLGRAMADHMITQIEIFGAGEPVDGAKPDYEVTLAPDSDYALAAGNGSVKWYDHYSGKEMGKNDKFKAGESYRIEVRLEPTGSSCFAPANEIQATVNGKNGDVGTVGGKNPEQRTVVCVFRAKEAGQLIREVAIESIVPPTQNAKPSYDATALHNTYHVDFSEGIHGVRWEYADNPHYTVVTASDKFESRYAYKVLVYVAAEEKEMFAAEVAATINGNDAEVTHISDTQLMLSYTFPAQEKGNLWSPVMYVTQFTYPQAGSAPDFSVVVQDAWADTVIWDAKVSWRDLKTNKALSATDTFESGHTYQFTVETGRVPGAMYTKNQKFYLRPDVYGYDLNMATTVFDESAQARAHAVFTIDVSTLYGAKDGEQQELEEPVKEEPVVTPMPGETEIPDGADVGTGSIKDMLGEEDDYFYYEIIEQPEDKVTGVMTTYPIYVGVVVDPTGDEENEEGAPKGDEEGDKEGEAEKPGFVVIVPPKGEDPVNPDKTDPADTPITEVKPTVPTVPVEPIPLPEIWPEPDEPAQTSSPKRTEQKQTAAAEQEEAANPLYLIAPKQKVNGIVSRSEYGNAMALYNAQLAGMENAMGLKLAADSVAGCGNDIVYISDLEGKGVYDAFFKLFDFASEYAQTDLYFGPLDDMQPYKVFALLQSAPSADPNALCNYTQIDTAETMLNYARTLVYSADRLTATKLSEGENLLTLVVWDRSHAGRWLMIVAERQ